jgi:predicted kinase
MVLMAGLTGTGKSGLARALGRELGWPVIDKDVFKSRLLDAGMPDKAAGRTSYDITLTVAEDLLVGQRLSVIVDTPALYPEVMDRATRIAETGGARLKVIYCTLDLDARTVRLANRQGLRSQPSAPHAHEGDGTKLFGHLPADTLRVVTDRPVADLLAEVLTYLGPRARSRYRPPG